MIRYIVPIVAVLLAATPAAQAADLATIGCIAEKVELPIRAQIVLDVERNLTEVGKKHTYDPRVTVAIGAAGKVCAEQHGWPPEAVEPAMRYTLATLGWTTAQKIATERGFDVAALEELWATVPYEARNQVLPATEYQRLVREFVTDEKQQTRENAELVNELLGFLSIMQYSSYAFSQA